MEQLLNPATQTPIPHKRIAVLIPAGEIVGHDRIVAYGSRDRTRTINAPLNIGDTFVFESTLQLINYEQISCFNTYSKNVDEAVAALNECEVAIIRGSNYIHPQMDWGNLPQVIERSRVPIVAFGIGAQAPRYEPIPLSESSIRFLRVLGERAYSVGCRGSFTASVLYDIGVKNVSPIGCPSLFRANNPGIRVDWPPERIDRIGFTTTRGFSPGYCDSIERATATQLDMLKRLSASFDLYVLSQGELAEKIFYYRAYDRIEEAKLSMKRSGWDLGQAPWLEELYWRRIFHGLSPADYETMVKQCDLVMGYRLHGNIMALSQGIPAIYVTYDSRTREIVDQLSIPHWDIMDGEDFSLERYLSLDTFASFNQRFAINYGLVREFLSANGVRHRMADQCGAP